MQEANNIFPIWVIDLESRLLDSFESPEELIQTYEWITEDDSDLILFDDKGIQILMHFTIADRDPAISYPETPLLLAQAVEKYGIYIPHYVKQLPWKKT